MAQKNICGHCGFRTGDYEEMQKHFKEEHPEFWGEEDGEKNNKEN